MTSPGEFQIQWQNKWVKLSYSQIGMNQMDVTEYQVITKLTFRGFKVFNGEVKSLIRSGHPCKEDAENNSLPYIEDVKGTWANVRLDLKLEKEDGEWKLMHETEMIGFETMQALDIEEFDMSTINESLVMPPPNKCTRIKF